MTKSFWSTARVMLDNWRRRRTVWLVIGIVCVTLLGFTWISSWGSSASSDEPPPTTNLAPPISRAELGRASWALLHMVASKFPDAPTLPEQMAAYNLITSLSQLYPCTSCAKHFRQFIEEHPPTPTSKKEFATWICNAHNNVNTRQNKPTVDCSTVLDLWPEKLRNDCGCMDLESSTGGFAGVADLQEPGEPEWTVPVDSASVVAAKNAQDRRLDAIRTVTPPSSLSIERSPEASPATVPTQPAAKSAGSSKSFLTRAERGKQNKDSKAVDEETAFHQARRESIIQRKLRGASSQAEPAATRAPDTHGDDHQH